MTTNTSRLWRTGLRAGMVAAILNTALYRFGNDWDIFPAVRVLPSANDELSLLPLIAASVGAVLLGTLLYHFLDQRVRRPLTAIYFVVLFLVLIASFGPVAMSNWTDRQVLYVNLMHMVVAVSTLVALWHWEHVRSKGSTG
jgi:hypothetical protein